LFFYHAFTVNFGAANTTQNVRSQANTIRYLRVGMGEG
jgi:hypothetical protein